MNSTLSEYEAPISEEYNVVDSSSSAYSNQKSMDHVSTQAKENASGDTMSTPSSKDDAIVSAIVLL